MSRIRRLLLSSTLLALASCASAPEDTSGTLAELGEVPADVEDVYLEDGLERAAESYRRYLEETPKTRRTPEAMRRLADLQIEQEYGVLGDGGSDYVEMAAPEAAAPVKQMATTATAAKPAVETESERAFEERATQRTELLAAEPVDEDLLVGADGQPIPAGPREAIKTYHEILEQYPNYERNDQVLYQLSRAYDEISEPDKAMEVMNRFVKTYPYSRYVDEVNFRRGEYYFVRRKFFEAEEAYGAIIRVGDSSSYYELALYKLGWSLYKQEMYEEALHQYMAMLDHRLAIGFDFDELDEKDEEHRVSDTFRVISLSFSNLGGPEVLDEYFSNNGHRSYADKIYGNLGEFYFSKLRYDDAAQVYKSFINLNPYHRKSPYFGMRVIEIYGEALFPQLVVEAKKDFATRYAIDAEYWQRNDIEESPEVTGFLKTNLTDLANHYHALYREPVFEDEQPQNFAEASRWYRQYLGSFPEAEETPQINYQLADLLRENGNFGDAAIEYERTAYDYGDHEQAAEAGYAAIYAHRENLKLATGARTLEVKKATVESSLRFSDVFPDHEQAPIVLGAAADDLYEMNDFERARDSGSKLIDRYPDSEPDLLRAAWTVVAHSSIDLADYPSAEHAYGRVLVLTPEDDETRPDIIDGLAAAIYKQGEQANEVEDYRAAANHFLRIKELAPTSAIRVSAEYDAAAALMKLEDWTMASGVLEEFRTSHPDHELSANATKQLAFIYREDGQTERSAREHERIAAEALDPELSREALLSAAELYDEAKVMADAIRVYRQYVDEYPRPLDFAMEARSRLSEIFKDSRDYERYYAMLNEIVESDREAGADRTDRSRFLASQAGLVLAQEKYERFAELELVQPFEESLVEKQLRMDIALEAFNELVDYQVADVTAAATFYLAEIYFEFSSSLLESERPGGLSEAEKIDYEMVIEEEAFPFEERAIDVHEENLELLAAGVYNEWVQQSLDKLAVLMPGRYAKNEISSGFVGSVGSYAYRMPIAPPPVEPESVDEATSIADSDPID